MANNKKQEEQRKERVVSARRRVEQKAAESGGSRTIKLPSGVGFLSIKTDKPKNLNVIPYIKSVTNSMCDAGEPYFEHTYYCHNKIGPNNDRVVCLARTYNEPCPVCEYRNELSKSINPADKEGKKVLNALNPSQRQLFNVIDDEEKEKGVQVWDVSFFCFGKHLDKKIRTAREAKREQYETFADLRKGSTLRIVPEEQDGGGFKFLMFNDIEFDQRTKPLPDSLMDESPVLDSLVDKPPYKQVKALLHQEPEEDPEDDDDVKDVNGVDHHAPAAPSKGKAAPKKAEVEEEDEDEEVVPPPRKESAAKPSKNGHKDEEEGEEEKPAPKAGWAKGSYVTYKGEECEVMRVTPDGKYVLEEQDGTLHRGVTLAELLKENKAKGDDEAEDADEGEAEEEAPKPKKIVRK